MNDLTTILAVDSDPWAAMTYAENIPSAQVVCVPVSEVIGVLPYADLIIAGPPCQPHSLADKIIGNGHASIQVWHLRQALQKSDPAIRTAISLFCGGGLGDVGMHGRLWSFRATAAGMAVPA